MLERLARCEPDFDRERLDVSVPVLVMGGRENSLSLARSLGRAGVAVRVSGPADCWGMYSRHCRQNYRIPSRRKHSQFWHDLLLGPQRDRDLEGSLLIGCSDSALEFLAAFHDELRRLYRLDHGDPAQRAQLLDKQATLELARAAGVATPDFRRLEGERDLDEIRDRFRYPAMVKPIHSHKFIQVFGRKLFIVHNFEELAGRTREAWKHGLEVMAVEMIPGPDSALSSYYTYIDADLLPRFEYTKRIIRRFPVNRGLASYHASQWLPETAEAGRRFFEGIGFTGLGNIEFKRDPRDGILKVIETNARFTAAQELVVRSGAPIDLIYYCAATGQPAPVVSTYREMTYWYSLRDFLAFLQLRKRGELTLAGWLKSIWPLDHVSPLHDWRDPAPSLAAGVARVARTIALLLPLML